MQQMKYKKSCNRRYRHNYQDCPKAYYKLKKRLINRAWVTQVIVPLNKALPYGVDQYYSREGIHDSWHTGPPKYSN